LLPVSELNWIELSTPAEELEIGLIIKTKSVKLPLIEVNVTSETALLTVVVAIGSYVVAIMRS
jgi:hypothetical protein